jgi:hypothetical protein
MYVLFSILKESLVDTITVPTSAHKYVEVCLFTQQSSTCLANHVAVFRDVKYKG